MIPIEWPCERATVEDMELEHTRSGPHASDSPEKRLPFGYQNAAWLDLKARMQDGDELWYYASPAESWDCLAGRAGVALIRRGEVIGDLTTMMN